MTTDFIELDRTFAKFEPGNAEEHASRYVPDYWGKRLHWPDVLKVPCSVVFAEGGSGKSMEMKQRAVSLENAGEQAFFCSINELAKTDLADCLWCRG
jgi:hypothetical protein